MGFILTDIEREYRRRQKLINLYQIMMEHNGYYFGLSRSRKIKTIIFPGIVKKSYGRNFFVQPLFGEPKAQYDSASNKECFDYYASKYYYEYDDFLPDTGDIVEVQSLWYKYDESNYTEDKTIIFSNDRSDYLDDYYKVKSWNVVNTIIKNQAENPLKDYSLDKLRSEYLSRGGNLKDLELPPKKVQIQEKITRPKIYYTWEGTVELITTCANLDVYSCAVKPLPGTNARKQYDLYLKRGNLSDELSYLERYWDFELQNSLVRKKYTISEGDHVIVKLLTNKYLRGFSADKIYYSNAIKLLMSSHAGLPIPSLTNHWYISEKI